jgi:hypothetical protein
MQTRCRRLWVSKRRIFHRCRLRDDLKNALIRGWNTFNVTIISTQILFPEGLALNLQIDDTISGDTLSLMFTGYRVKESERVRILAHIPEDPDVISRYNGEFRNARSGAC